MANRFNNIYILGFKFIINTLFVCMYWIFVVLITKSHFNHCTIAFNLDFILFGIIAFRILAFRLGIYNICLK